MKFHCCPIKPPKEKRQEKRQGWVLPLAILRQTYKDSQTIAIARKIEGLAEGILPLKSKSLDTSYLWSRRLTGRYVNFIN